MDFTPLHAQADRLNRNLETLIGLMAAAGSTVQDATAIVAGNTAPAPATAIAAAEAPTEKKGRGRPRIRYFYNSSRHFVQENTDSPGKEWVEITKTKYEEIRDKIASGELKPVYDAPTTAGTATPAPVQDDPFADEPAVASAKAFTLDDVRNAAFKVRDKFGMDKAKGLIGKYAAKLDQVAETDFAALIADCEKTLAPDDL